MSTGAKKLNIHIFCLTYEERDFIHIKGDESLGEGKLDGATDAALVGYPQFQPLAHALGLNDHDLLLKRVSLALQGFTQIQSQVVGVVITG